MKENEIIINLKERFSIDDIYSYLIDSEKLGFKVALNKLLVKSLNLDEKTILSDKKISESLSKFLKNEIWISKYFNNNADIYSSFYHAVKSGIDNYSEQIISSNFGDILFSIAQKITNSILLTTDLKLKHDLYNYRTLLKGLTLVKYNDNDSDEIDKNIEKIISYGWPLSLDLDSIIYDDITNRKQVNEYYIHKYNKSKINSLRKEIGNRLKFDKDLIRYFKEAKKAYDTGLYYSCSSMLFAIIDKLISMCFSSDIGCNGISKLRKSLKKENLYNLYVNYSTIRILFNIYDDTSNFSIHRNELNRNIIDHGWSSRKIKSYECLQIFLLVNNLLFILIDETDILEKSIS